MSSSMFAFLIFIVMVKSLLFFSLYEYWAYDGPMRVPLQIRAHDMDTIVSARQPRLSLLRSNLVLFTKILGWEVLNHCCSSRKSTWKRLTISNTGSQYHTFVTQRSMCHRRPDDPVLISYPMICFVMMNLSHLIKQHLHLIFQNPWPSIFYFSSGIKCQWNRHHPCRQWLNSTT